MTGLMPVRDQCAPPPDPGGGAHRRIGAVHRPPERPDPPSVMSLSHQEGPRTGQDRRDGAERPGTGAGRFNPRARLFFPHRRADTRSEPPVLVRKAQWLHLRLHRPFGEPPRLRADRCYCNERPVLDAVWERWWHRTFNPKVVGSSPTGGTNGNTALTTKNPGPTERRGRPYPPYPLLRDLAAWLSSYQGNAGQETTP